MERTLKKITVDAFTCTTLDQEDARNLSHVQQAKDEIAMIQREMDEGAQDIDEFLKNKAKLNMELDPSQAQDNLKGLLKDLAREKKKMDRSKLEI